MKIEKPGVGLPLLGPAKILFLSYHDGCLTDGHTEAAMCVKWTCLGFQSIGLWADAFYKSKCLYVCLCVCVCPSVPDGLKTSGQRAYR